MGELPKIVMAKESGRGWRLDPRPFMAEKVMVPERSAERFLRDGHDYEVVALVRDTAPGERRGVKILKLSRGCSPKCLGCELRASREHGAWIKSQAKEFADQSLDGLKKSVADERVVALMGFIRESNLESKLWLQVDWAKDPEKWVRELVSGNNMGTDTMLESFRKNISGILELPEKAAALLAKLQEAWGEYSRVKAEQESAVDATADAVGPDPGEVTDSPDLESFLVLEEKLRIRLVFNWGSIETAPEPVAWLEAYQWYDSQPGMDYESEDGFGTRSTPGTPEGFSWGPHSYGKECEAELEKHLQTPEGQAAMAAHGEYLKSWHSAYLLKQKREEARKSVAAATNGRLNEAYAPLQELVKQIPRDY